MSVGLTRLAAVGMATVVAIGGSTVVASGAGKKQGPGKQNAKTAGTGDGTAKNIILLIGDGMGVTHTDAARLRYYGAAGRLNMEKLPALGMVKTYSVLKGSDKPNYVPDSAATSTAWSSGVKTYNGALGMDANGNDVPTIMEQAKQAGLRTGNVSTAEITDATPAGMFSHVPARSCQGPTMTSACGGRQPIAHQIASNNVADVILGGGLSRFEPDDQAKMEANGYEVLGSFGDAAKPLQDASTQRVATRSDLERTDASKMIGLFNRGNMTVEKYKRENPGSEQAKEPALPEMTKRAIELLSAGGGAGEDASRGRGHEMGRGRGHEIGRGRGHEMARGRGAGEDKGFFLQVESALIDKRSHANDAAQTLEETKNFDDAVAAAVEFAERDGNTLVIVTADHECAGFNIIGKGSFTNAEALAPPGNKDGGNPANNSTPSRERADNKKDPSRSSGPVNGSGSGDPRNFAPATFRTPDDPEGVQDGSVDASLWLSYLSGSHTGADVPIYAYGRGSDRFDEAIDNTDIYKRMFEALAGV